MSDWNFGDFESPELLDTRDWTRRIEAAGPRELQALEAKNGAKTCMQAVHALGDQLKSVFYGKDELIDCMLFSTIAQLPLLMLGTWGTAKSMLVRKMAEGLGIYPRKWAIDDEDDLITRLAAKEPHNGQGQDRSALSKLLDEAKERRHFEYLVTRFTTPEELLGGVAVDVMLEKSIHIRNTRGLLPRAELIFLDEVFKANSAILNTLLSVINERLLYNAGLPWATNMVMLFGASNEEPQEEDLGAFYDRFPVHVLCESVARDEPSARELLDRAHTQSFSSLIPRPARGASKEVEQAHSEQMSVLSKDSRRKLEQRRMSRCASINHFRALHKLSLFMFGGVEIPKKGDEFTDAFLHTFLALRGPYDISDRSLGHYYRLARAHALYRGRDKLLPEDCIVLQYAAKSKDAALRLPAIVDELIRSERSSV